MSAPVQYNVLRSGAEVTVRHELCGANIGRERTFTVRELVQMAEAHESACRAVAELTVAGTR